MKRITSIQVFILIANLFILTYGDNGQLNKQTKKPVIQIIIGSTRQGRVSEKIGSVVENIIKQNNRVHTELIDLKNYDLPFLADEVPPMMREKISDPIMKQWSEKIAHADAFIIITPEYNSGYPGVLKNALDSLYKEWNNKPVAFIGHSGGDAGGANAITQLHQVVKALQMKIIKPSITIPHSWKAFDGKGICTTEEQIRSEILRIIDQIFGALS